MKKQNIEISGAESRKVIDPVECYEDIIDRLDNIIFNMEVEESDEHSSVILKVKVDLLNLKSEIKDLEFREYKEYIG